jgi:hypothetical protein
MASAIHSSNNNSALAMIERELAALQEAKMMNAHALRTAVIEGQLRNAERVAALPPRPSAGGAGAPGLLLQGEARVAWEQAIIEDELSRPLEVPVEFVQDLAKREAQTEERLLKGLSKHQEALEGMKVRLLKREAEAEKTYAFKTAKEVLGPRPDTLEGYQSSLLGSFEGSELLKTGTINGAALDTASTSSKKSPSRRSQRSGESGIGGAGASSTSASNSTSGTAALTHFTLAEGRVLDSLARLEQLEQRIQDLEARTSGQDLAELLGITVPVAPGDGGTGSSSAAALRSAYAAVPLSGSASTKSPKKSAGGAAGAGGGSVFSTGSRVAAPGGVPKVGFAPVLGTVYTRKRVPSLNPSEPSRTVYLLERIEEATAKRGITLGPHGEFSMRFDNTDSSTTNYLREPGDTGGSASGRNSTTFGLSGLGDDDILDTDAMVANVPVETSDAIDRWLATKQRQVATTLQVRAAETVMKTSIVDSKKKALVASSGKSAVGTGAAAVRAAQQTQIRGRQPTGALSSNTNTNQRLANSMGPVAGVRGRPLVKQVQPTPKPGPNGGKTAASGDFHRRAARTVAVGSNISKVLQDERNRQAAKARLNRAPISKSAAALKAEKASARNQTKRVALSQFDDIRKKFQTQKDNAGLPKLGTSTVLKSPAKSTLSHTRNVNIAAKPSRTPKPTDPNTSGQKRPLLPRGQSNGPKAAPVSIKPSATVSKPAPHEAYTKKVVVKVIQQGGGEMKDSNTLSTGPLKFGVMGPMQALKIEELKGFSQKKMEAAKAQLKPGSVASGKIGGPISTRAAITSPKTTTAGASVPLDIKSQLSTSVSGKDERKSLFASTGGVRMDTLESLQMRKDENKR